MNNNILYSFIAFINSVLISCHSNESDETKTTKLDSSKVTLPLNTTDMVFTFDQEKIPLGFGLDTLEYYDSCKRVYFTMYWFKAKADTLQEYNKAIINEFNTQVKRELSYYEIPNDEYSTASVEYGPQQINVTNNIISTQFICDSYSDGGAHHNYSWYSINYGLKAKTVLRFRDIFALKKTKDTLAFLDTIGNSITDRPIHIGRIGNDTIDFFLNGDTIEFGPYLSWAEGMHTARVHKNYIKRYLIKLIIN